MEQSVNFPIQPSISIIIPTLNSSVVLEECLKSIDSQDYPRGKIEIIIADGGSQDNTMEIAKKYKAKIFNNPLKTGEAGKAVALKYARNELIAFVDSDNILPQVDWLKRMVEPFNDPEIFASEPVKYTYRINDGYITRYCALLGMNDPLCLFLGNYDRYSLLTDKWTETPNKEEDKGNYLKIELNNKYLPTIGANGFFIRRSILERYNIGDYLFDIDIIYELLNPKSIANHANTVSSFRFAKVKIGIIHIFSGNIKTFVKKQKRRIKDYIYYYKLGIRKYPWESANKVKLLKFIISCLTVIPLLCQSVKGYIKKPDKAWFFHPIACWLTLWVYGWGRISSIFYIKELKREGWKQ